MGGNASQWVYLSEIECKWKTKRVLRMLLSESPISCWSHQPATLQESESVDHVAQVVMGGNDTWSLLVSEHRVQNVLFRFLEPKESWSLLGSCFDTYEWGSVATFNTASQRETGCNLIVSDLHYAAQYRLWGYNHS